MNKDKVWRKNPDMITRQIENEVILLPVYKTSDEIDCIYTLNKAASRVWDMIDGKKTVAKIKKEVLEDFQSTDREADEEMAKLLKDLKKIKAIK